MTWPVILHEDRENGGYLIPSRLVRLTLPGANVETLHVLGQHVRHQMLWILTPPVETVRRMDGVRRNCAWGSPEGDLTAVDAVRPRGFCGEWVVGGLAQDVGSTYPYDAIRWYGKRLGMDLSGLRADIERSDFTKIEMLYDRVRRLEHDLEVERFLRETMQEEWPRG